MGPLGTRFEADARPYFLWDELTTTRMFREALSGAGPEEKARLLGKLLREARDPDVWQFTTLDEVRELYPRIVRYLGRRRAFWAYLMSAWRADDAR